MKFIICFLFLFVTQALAKNVDTLGAVSFISLQKKVSNYGFLNFYHYDVFSFEKKEMQGREFPAGLHQSNFQTSYTYQYLPNIALTGGHIYQRTNPPGHDEFQDEHRIFQQATIAFNHARFSSTHRFRFEERFVNDREEDRKDFRTRLRYQIGAKVPLRGIVIDPNEYYINTYNEFYFSTTGQRNALYSDNWTYFGLGKKTKSSGSFEIGPLVQWVRVDRDKNTRTHYTVQAGWIVSF